MIDLLSTEVELDEHRRFLLGNIGRVPFVPHRDKWCARRPLATEAADGRDEDEAFGFGRQPASRVPRRLESRLTAALRKGILKFVRAVEACNPCVGVAPIRLFRASSGLGDGAEGL